jgi:hypothetical protein
MLPTITFARHDEEGSTVQLQLSELTETVRRADMQEIRIIGFFFEHRIR